MRRKQKEFSGLIVDNVTKNNFCFKIPIEDDNVSDSCAVASLNEEELVKLIGYLTSLLVKVEIKTKR